MFFIVLDMEKWLNYEIYDTANHFQQYRNDITCISVQCNKEQFKPAYESKNNRIIVFYDFDLIAAPLPLVEVRSFRRFAYPLTI